MNSSAPSDTTDALPPVFAGDLPRTFVVGCLVILLPLFGQTFHYITALYPLWALSKAFPILTLPLVLRLGSQPRFPMTRQVLLSFAWLLLVPSFAAVIYFHESVFVSVTAQVKLLPILYFFSFLALLLMLKPTLNELARSFLILGAAIVGALIVMWIVVPASWYKETYVFGQAPFFTSDSRGHRIRMSMYFPFILLFFCYRRAFFERHLGYLAGALVGLAVALLIVKSRALAIGIMGVLVINTFVWARPRARIGLLLVAPVALAAIFSMGYLATIFSAGTETGFDTRRISAQLATRFLGDDWMRWLFGVGTISPASGDTLTTYFHHFFFLADITWLGIVFEFGLIGALLIVCLQLRGLFFYRRLRVEVEDDFLGALYDYLVFVLLASFFYPPTLAPGETAVILAIFAYIWRAGGFDHRADLRSLHAPRVAAP
ncbi:MULTISPECIES: hypothetical protein [Pandoraea]|uniref:Uncharacterized protein n=1 Tax=Pandoraea communis TaxID=2508297 RepID=A0A5E4XQT7_9BURK|nr:MULTISPECIES: hypothetical protein [Pandoraea]EON10803.1 hypothetical protein C266_25035 [Pandoraea sp. SD6-2]VVE38686.1 hypothetical protein PCO31110_04081 [Pandoraea communis]